MSDILLIDTDVFIDYLRGEKKAVDYYETLTAPISVSVITVAELYTGIRSQAEEEQLDAVFNLTTVFEVDLEVSKQGGKFRRKYLRTHSVEIPDALIAATAEVHGCTLVTLNKKHYPMLLDLIIPYKK